MESAGEFLLKESRRRRIKNALIKYSVMSGGILVLMMLALIFFYLLYVVTPIFSSPSVSNTQRYSVPVSGFQPLSFNTHDNVLFQFNPSGALIAQSFPADRNESVMLGEAQLPYSMVSSVVNRSALHGVAFLNSEHQIQFAIPVLNVESKNASRVAWQALFDGNRFDVRSLGLTRLVNASFDDTKATVIGETAQGEWRVFRVVSENKAGSLIWKTTSYRLPMNVRNIKQWFISTNAQRAYALTSHAVYVIDLFNDKATVRDVLSPTDSTQFVKMALLSGGESVLTLTTDHQLFRWFETVQQGKREWVMSQSYQIAAEPVTHILIDAHKKNFYLFYQNGDMSGYYATQDKPLFSDNLFSSAPNAVMLSRDGRDLWTENAFQWHKFQLKNAYSELSGSSLFQKTWYEHYDQPDYVWQPTSPSENKEPKLSLLPLLSGTLKATVVAMIFAIPLAVLGAIYTAYFMSTKVRHIVKPTIELMEALPTVILGFLAGIWLAPIIEMHLIGALGFLILSPIFMLFVGGLWGSLPNYWRHKIPNGFHIALLMPMLILLGWGCLHWGSYFETWMFGSDVIHYVDRELGVGYEQRNALVVGIAMGFAVIPTIFTIAEDAIHSVPNHLVKGSLALGATHWQTLTRVVLLTASPGIFSAIIMGVGRAVGETMIVIMATGNTPIMDWNILHGLRSLAASIAIEMPESDVGSAHYRVLFLGAFFLFLFTFVFNTLAEVIRQRLRDKYRSLS